MRPWQRQIELLTSDEATNRLPADNPSVGQGQEQLLITLLRAHGQAEEIVAPLLPQTAPGVVRRAEAFIEAHTDRALQLQDIADAADTPVRTLLANFRHFRGTTPMQWLRDVRLDRAHTGLPTRVKGLRVDAASKAQAPPR